MALERAARIAVVGLPILRRRWDGLRPGQLALHAFTGLVIAFLILPTLLVIPMSFSGGDYLEFPPSSWSLRWYRAYFADSDWIEPTLFSFKIALLTTALSTVSGTMAALALVRGRVAGRAIVDALVVAPLIAPAIVFAIAVYLRFARWGLVGTTAGFALAHSVLCVPFVILTVSAALARFDAALELAAMSLGASRGAAVLRVTLPVVLPAVLAGAALAFITSFDEAVVSFFLSGIGGKTLPKKMFEGIESEISPVVAAVSALLTVLSCSVAGMAGLFQRRSARRVAAHLPAPDPAHRIDPKG